MASYNPKDFEEYHQAKSLELRQEIEKIIRDYIGIASKNRVGDWEEGRYKGVQELGIAILKALKINF